MTGVLVKQGNLDTEMDTLQKEGNVKTHGGPQGEGEMELRQAVAYGTLSAVFANISWKNRIQRKYEVLKLTVSMHSWEPRTTRNKKTKKESQLPLLNKRGKTWCCASPLPRRQHLQRGEPSPLSYPFVPT